MRESERTLFLLLGHAVNEINVLNKLFYFANNYDHETEWRRHAHLTQGLVLVRALIGKLNETWELLNKTYFKTQLSKLYGPKLNPDAAEAVQNLGKYFGKSNLIRKLRNSFSFHYDASEISKINPHDLGEDELVVYMAQNNGNSVYYASEYAVNVAILESIVPGNAQESFDKLLLETTTVVGWLNEAAQGIMAEIADLYLAPAHGPIPLEPIDIGELPSAESVIIPYFTASPSPDEEAPSAQQSNAPDA